MIFQSTNSIAPPADTAETGQKPGLSKDQGITFLLLTPQDADRVHACWEVAPYTWTEIKKLFGPSAASEGKTVLRFSWDKDAPTRKFDAGVRIDSRSCNVRLPRPPDRCRAELGLILPYGIFARLAVSNEIRMEPSRLSRLLDEKWSHSTMG